MVRATTTYHCEKCRSRHVTHRDAQRCEDGHAITEAVERTREAIAAVFQDATSTIVAKRKTPSHD